MRVACRAFPILLLLACLAPLLRPRGAGSVPLYAARTGLMCGSCHFDPNGGGPRNEFGFTFARNRHSLAAEPDTNSEWKDLQVVNRVSENVPVYIGFNYRLLMLADATTNKDSLDRLAFFNMENALHVTIQPHHRLTFVYSGPFSGFAGSDVFGMVSGFPLNGYFKAGNIRTPFGLRMDDHTVATRNSFLDFAPPLVPGLETGSFLPYDPRRPDYGLEMGGDNGQFFGRAAFTNGQSSLFFGNTFAEAKTLKLGYGRPGFQTAVSIYDDYQKDAGSFIRSTRWGAYGLTHYGQFSVIGELDAGTVHDTDPLEPRRNLLAGFAELNYTPKRSLNFRVRYDRLEMNRSSQAALRDLNTHERYALEGEILPVPFAELRWTLRRIDHKAAVAGLPDENQAYLQAHFSF